MSQSPEADVRRRVPRIQVGAAVWLTLLWLVLWRDITPLLVIGGVIVAILVQLVFPLPPLRMQVRPNPVGIAVLLLVFLRDVVVASWQVIRIVLRRRPVTNAVVAVQLRTPSDLVLTVVGEMLSLIPGSVLVEARRASHTLYMHVLDVDDEQDVEDFRALALAQESRVLRAFGIDQSRPGSVTGLREEEDFG